MPSILDMDSYLNEQILHKPVLMRVLGSAGLHPRLYNKWVTKLPLVQ